MTDPEIGDREARDISNVVTRLFRDLGNPDPPVVLLDVRELLRLDLRYYSSSNTSALTDFAHKMKLAGKQVLARPTLLVEAIKKSNLSALWLPDRKRILLDQDQPKARHRWMETHEIGHSITPWHQQFTFGDNEFTLSPDCHAQVEAEANFAAKELLFMQERFGGEARDLRLSFETAQQLAKRYGNSLTSTFWRLVQDRDPNTPVFGLVSAHPHHPSIGSMPDGSPVRHFIGSRAFVERFAGVTQEEVFAVLAANANWRKKGPIASLDHVLVDSNGDGWEFHIESFCNSYAVMTYGHAVRRHRVSVSVAS